MKHINYCLMALLFGGLLSCQTASEKEAKDPEMEKAQTIYTEAIAIHDEVMPRMDDIMRLKRKLNAQKDSLSQLGADTYAARIDSIELLVANLEKADKAMMQWMRSIKQLPAELSDEEYDLQTQSDTSQNRVPVQQLIEEQEAQKEAIVEVKAMMEESIAEAKAYLQ